MQERYLGDSHDFIKYALLRHIHRCTGARLAVNWYLTDPAKVDRAGNKDGEKRHHLSRPEWGDLDAELLSKLRHYEQPSRRLIKNVERDGILPPDTLYFDEEVANANERTLWHSRARQALKDGDIIFLDPDNGFQVPSMSKGRSRKYALYSEGADYLRDGKACISIQFARQCDPIARGRTVRTNLHKVALPGPTLPIIRGRVAPNILFIAICPGTVARQLDSAFRSFSERCRAKIEVVE